MAPTALARDAHALYQRCMDAHCAGDGWPTLSLRGSDQVLYLHYIHLLFLTQMLDEAGEFMWAFSAHCMGDGPLRREFLDLWEACMAEMSGRTNLVPAA
jgi:hypothetical protein